MTPSDKCWICGGSKAETIIVVQRETPEGKDCDPKEVRVHFPCYMDMEP